MAKNNIVGCLTSRKFHRGGGIPVATRNLFEQDFEIFYLEDFNENLELEKKLSEFELVLVSGYEAKLENLLRVLKARGTKIAVYWHFSVTVLIGDAEHTNSWVSLSRLADEGVVDGILACKSGFIEMLAKLKKFAEVPLQYVMNNVPEGSYKHLSKNGCGIYSGSGDFWVKNSVTNLFAAAMHFSEVDVVPLSNEIQELGRSLGILVTGEKRLDHEAFLERMSRCEIVLYTTFTEACPMTPLEALSNGTLCLTGDNHAYWTEGSVLYSYLVCNRPDDPEAIFNKMKIAIENKSRILKEYEIWKKDWDEKCHKNFQEVLNFLKTL